jgi:hypothetical protein
MAFEDGFNTVLASAKYIQQQGDLGAADRKQKGLASLAASVAQGNAPDYQGIAANGGDPMAFRADAQKQVGQIAGYLAAIPDANARNAAYQQMKPRLMQFAQANNLPLPDTLDDSHLPELQAIAQTWGDKSNSIPAELQSFNAMSQGLSPEDQARARRINLGLDPRALAPQVVQGAGGMYGVDRNNYSAAPITMGGQAPQTSQGQQVNAPGASDAFMAAANMMAQNGVPAEKIDAWLQQQMGGQPAPQGAQLQAPPKEQQPAEFEKKAAFLRARGVPEDQITQMVLGGSAPDVTGPPSPAEVDFYAQMSNAGDYSWATGMARGKSGQALIAAVRKRQVELANGSGMAPQDITANRANVGALSATLKDRQKYASAVQNLNGTLDRQAGLVESLLAKGAANGQSPILNRWIQAGRKQIAGDPDVTALDIAIRGLGREHQRVLTGPLSNAQLQQGAQDTADSLVNAAMTPEQIRAAIKTMKAEARNGLDQNNATLADLKQQLSHINRPAAANGGSDINDLLGKYGIK